jgi:hypothetical protein
LPCQNGGSCNNYVGQYKCTCLAGYTGVNCETATAPLVDACGPNKPLVLTDGTGKFSSLNYPEAYPNNLDCQWRIVSSFENGFVKFQFEDGLLEAVDRVTVYDGYDSSDSTKLRDNTNFVYGLGSPIISTQRYLFVEFITDFSGANKGFRANYTSLQP